MKYKSIASPEASKGVKIAGKKQVVPNQALSLAEILERFTRGEPLEIGRGEGQYHESNDDLEKLQHMDPVDREEYVEALKRTQKTFKKQEKDREAAKQEELDRLAVEKIVNDKLAAAKASPTP